MSCAQLLDLPSDPKLAPDAPTALESTPPEMVPSSDVGRAGDGERVETPSLADPDTERSAPQTSTSKVSPSEGPLDTPSEQLSGSNDAGAPEPPEPARLPPAACTTSVIDIVLLFDNSGSMEETTVQAELALLDFALRLEAGGVDYRIILISRHRAGDRETSAVASTSVCVAAPLSGLAECPAERPAPTRRFFHYSTKIEASDSFERALEAASNPDDFGLTDVGWLEWLRPESRIEIIEITDADSDVEAAAFVAALAELAPERFSSELTAPGFVFHAITGISEKLGPNNFYLEDEPIEPQFCTRLEGDPDNAGVAYQTLSRATGGLRQSVCPSAALGTRLGLVADLMARNISACP